MNRWNRVYWGLAGVALMLLALACGSKSRTEQQPISKSESLRVTSMIQPLRAYDQSWEADDQIGVFAVKSGQALSQGTIFGTASNVVYVTPAGDGNFRAVGSSIQLSRTEQVDLISYYPYQAVSADYQLSLDVSDQSDLSAIDLMYSNNAKGIDANNRHAQLQFTHQLSQLIVSVTAAGSLTDLAGLKVSVEGYTATGTYDLAAGRVATLGADKSKILLNDYATNGGTAEHRAMLLPGQAYEAMQLTFEIGGKVYKYQPTLSAELEPNKIYKLSFVLSEEGLLVVSGTIIEIVEGGTGTMPGKPSEGEVTPPAEEIPVSHKELEFEATDTAPIGVKVEALDNESWTASSSADFVKFQQTTTVGAGTLIISLTENSSTQPRTATVEIVGTRDSGASTSALRAAVVRKTIIKITQLGATPPPPKPDPEQRAWYMEQPLINSGMMTDATIAYHTAPDSWFAGGSTPGGVRRNYTIYFSKEYHQPYMVAYPLYKDCDGGAGRTNDWDWDPIIPREYQPDLSKAYNPSTYARGHMLASNLRQASRQLNRQTFFYTNMVPQEQNQNSGIWNQLETREKRWVEAAARTDTMYVVCGPTIDPNAITVTDRRGRMRIPVPTHTWKVLLKKDRSGNYVSIGVKMPNKRPEKGDKWQNHAVTVASLERELGVTFFTHLDPSIADAVKNQKNTSIW